MSAAAWKEGWGKPGLSRKWHWFRQGHSLCRKWIFFGDQLEQDGDNSPDHCIECFRALQKERAS